MINKINALLTSIDIDIENKKRVKYTITEDNVKILVRRKKNGKVVELFWSNGGVSFVLTPAFDWSDISHSGARQLIPMNDLETLKKKIIQELFEK